MFLRSTIASVALLASTVTAQTQSLWGQCGGRDYRGPTACPTGAGCLNDGNIWYSQCVPINYNYDDPVGGGAAVTQVLTTIFSVSGPQPTVVTTFITFLTPAPPPPPSPTWVTVITAVPDTPLKE